MKRAPYKWLRSINNMFALYDSVANTQEGVNFLFLSNFFDITQQTHLLQSFKVDECLYYQTEGIGNSMVFDNITISGYNYGGLNRLILANMPYNITFKNSRIIDASWGFERYGIIGVVGTVGCYEYFLSSSVFENNTFINTKGRTASHLPIQLWIDGPNQLEQYEIIFKNNWFANQTFGGLGLIYVYKADIVRLKIVMENNTFENLTNSVTDYPAINIMGEQVEIRRLNLRDSSISTFIQMTAWKGFINNLTLTNIIGTSNILKNLTSFYSNSNCLKWLPYYLKLRQSFHKECDNEQLLFQFRQRTLACPSGKHENYEYPLRKFSHVKQPSDLPSKGIFIFNQCDSCAKYKQAKQLKQAFYSQIIKHNFPYQTILRSSKSRHQPHTFKLWTRRISSI
ncbi:hypothetical protein FGO68_gene17183 [Halteria grandinella]|uniref:Uncharacterized protein n=1 Tax=Halteria grandinella TaxID=5974 RepID=A0A8J8P4G0_HALGN|nr:hypothetical protein FGO68_gene17183 [Halteria grandinella]